MAKKTKAELEREVKVLRERLEALEAPRECLDIQDEAPRECLDIQDAPARSEVLPGGGVARGAVLHVKVPVAPEDAPALPVVSQAFLEQLGNLPEGEQAGTDQPRAFPLVDGGYANAEVVEVVHHAGPGHVVVKVVR